MTSLVKKLAIALLIVLLAGAAYWAWAERQKRQQQQAIAVLVGDASAKLRAPLSQYAPEKAAGDIEAALESLHALKPGHPYFGQPELADAAEHYLLATRAIVQRRADGHRLAQQAAASRQKLQAHMRSVAHRDGGWIRDAAQLKKLVEKDYFDLEATLKALDELLGSLPETQKRLVPYVDASMLLEEKLREGARQRVQADLKRLSEDLQAIRSLGNPG